MVRNRTTLGFLAVLLVACGGGSNVPFSGPAGGGGAGPGPCDPSVSSCVECLTSADCRTGSSCVGNSCVASAACNNSLDCPTGQVCAPDSHTCVECTTDQDCGATGKMCSNRHCVEPCQSDRQCTPLGQLCDVGAGHCVQCLEARDCAGGQACKDGTCVTRTCSPGECKCGPSGVVICAPDGVGFVAAGALAGQCIGGPPNCNGAGGAAGGSVVDASSAGGGGMGGGGGGGGMAGAIDAGLLLLSDNFEDGVADGWSNVTIPVTGLPGQWSVVLDGSQVYRQSNNMDGSTQIAVAGNGAWTNVAAEARIKVFSFTSTFSSYFAGVCARVRDPDNWYCAAVRSDGRFSLRARLNAMTNTLGTAVTVEPPVATGVWYTVRLEIQGTTLRGYLNGVLQTTVTDPTIASGGVAVMGAGVVAEWDDVKIWPL